MTHYEQISNGARITGDVNTGSVLIPYAALTQWSDADLTRYGIRRVTGPIVPSAPGTTVIIPDKITNFQARAALLAASLFDAVDQWAKALGSNHPGFQAWEYANEFYRHGALLTEMAAQFGMSEQMLDELFIAGSKIDA